MSPPLQIKDDPTLVAPHASDPFAIERRGGRMVLAIDGRGIAMSAAPGVPIEGIAAAVARVPAPLRSSLAALVVSPEPNPADAAWSKRYGLPVRSGMGADASGSGRVVVYPHGLERLARDDGGNGFVKNLMHELGHCWSLRAWGAAPSEKDDWLQAIASDRTAPSVYAELAFQRSGSPDEDVAEATALHFLVRGTPSCSRYRDGMPARFALLERRFGGA